MLGNFVVAVVVFFILIQPHRSLLFPYTTLFRSGSTMQRKRGRPRRENDAFPDLLCRALGVDPSTSWRDRKSTRLNSSHRCISYAVFCLKKKKKPTQSRTWWNASGCWEK